MKRIIWHWTAGIHKATDLDKKHYHFLIEEDGTVVEGDHLPEANLSLKNGQYAAHTRGLNTGSIGIGICAMREAQEAPFKWGTHPMTVAQVEALIELTADLSETYKIPVNMKTMLSHGEVQQTLGVRQRGKWDIAVLPGMTRVNSSLAIGDILRKRVSQELQNRQSKVHYTWWDRWFLRRNIGV